MNIPIQNIYYLLCYAWDKLDEKEKVAVAAEDQTELIDLFAKILINATRIILKRGIDTTYVGRTDELVGIKGKLMISESLQRNLFPRQRALCEFDEFSPDILTNQLLISTLRSLMRTKGLKKNFKLEIRQLLYMFPGIKSIKIRSSHFKQIRLHRNNRFYDFILKICQLIHENLLPAEEPGNFQFMDFSRNRRQMNALFEAFIFQFYRREQTRFSVKRERIKWNLEAADQVSAQLLPRMNTDITLFNKKEKIIMDAKFYQNTMASNFDTEKIHSGHLYQIFSYLLNQETEDSVTTEAKGILIYPTINQEYNLRYHFQRHPMEVRTVDLNQPWQGIQDRLLDVITE